MSAIAGELPPFTLDKGKSREEGGRRTFQPVWGGSLYLGELEHRIWHPYGKTMKEAWRFKDAVLEAAEKFNESTKLPGMRAGLLGPSTLKVLEALFKVANFKTGRLDPSLDTIAKIANRCKRTVVTALARLKAHGFIDWLRRASEIAGAQGPGPRVTQETNAYWFRLSGRAQGLVRLALGRKKAPVPDCALARRKAAQEATEAMLETAPAEQQARFLAGDSRLGDALASFGRSLDTSASAKVAMNPDLSG